MVSRLGCIPMGIQTILPNVRGRNNLGNTYNMLFTLQQTYVECLVYRRVSGRYRALAVRTWHISTDGAVSDCHHYCIEIDTDIGRLSDTVTSRDGALLRPGIMHRYVQGQCTVTSRDNARLRPGIMHCYVQGQCTVTSRDNVRLRPGIMHGYVQGQCTELRPGIMHCYVQRWSTITSRDNALFYVQGQCTVTSRDGALLRPGTMHYFTSRDRAPTRIGLVS